MNESDFIAALRKLPLHEGARGLEDDCAVLEIGSETLILTHDTLVEGVHVWPKMDAADIAWKLVAVNLSDLASKGAEPVGILLGHSLGEDDERFLEGLTEVLKEYNVPLLGGDTIKANGPRNWAVTAIGRATHTPVPSRRGAQIGDDIYVTGYLGEAMLAFETGPDAVKSATQAYRRPIPQLEKGVALAPHVTAMMDISDGLLLDAHRMALASGVTFALDHHCMPFRSGKIMASWQDAIRWGEDYELLFTLPKGLEPPVAAAKIGAVETLGATPLMLDGDYLSDDGNLGYQHS